MRVNAVVVAAGKGERMGAVLPKPFLPVGGVPLLIRTLRNLARATSIGKFIVVIAPERENLCRDLLSAYGPFSVPICMTYGGQERQDSVRLGLNALDSNCEIVVIHDAARPFIEPQIVEASIIKAADCGGALVAVPTRDTIKRVDDNGTIAETVSRHDLWLAQTPQTFRVSLIREAHARAYDEGVLATDDATLVERLGGKVKIVLGSLRNFKITTPEDLQLAEAILRQGLGTGD